MTQMRWQHRSPSNVIDVADDHLINTTKETFVLLADIAPQVLRRLLSDFVNEIRGGLLELMCMTPAEMAVWHPNERYAQDSAGYVGTAACVGFRTEGLKLAWLRRQAIVKSLIQRRHLSEFTPSGRKRSISTKGMGPIAHRARNLPLKEQRAVIRDAFARADSIDDVFHFAQASVLGLESVLAELLSITTTAEMLNVLVEQASTFFHQTTKARPGQSSARGKGRIYAAPWFLMMLAREGLILWPQLQQGTEDLLPRMLKPFLWTILTPAHGRELSRTLASLEAA